MPRERDRESADRESANPAIDDFELTPSELEAGTTYNMSRVELVEACRLFRGRIQTSACPTLNVGCSPDKWALAFEDVDLLLRQLRIFMSMKVLWALFLEIDENVNGKVEVEEFIGMVSKLRGRTTMSPEFHLRSLPRTVKDQYCKLFEVAATSDLDESERKMMEKDDMVASCKKLHNHVNTNSEMFRQALEDLKVTDNKYDLTDFLIFQAKLRKPKPEIEVALLILTDEERAQFANLFREWRSKCHGNCSVQEIRVVLNQCGFHLTAEQCRNRMASLELDGSRPIQLQEFLYILINLGCGSCDKQRTVLLPGATYEEAFQKGFGLQEIWELGYDDLPQIKRAGWSVHNVAAAGFAEPWELRQVGYTAGELRKAGLSTTQLKLAGFSLEDLRNAGFSSAALHECCSDLGRMRPQKSSGGPGLALRPATVADRTQAAEHGEQRWWGTPRIQAMLQPDQSNESIMSLMSC